jgi:hypothetical protein
VLLELQEMCNHDLVTTLPPSALIMEAAHSSKPMVPTSQSYGLTFRGVHRVLVGKPEGKRSLGRPRRRLEDNIKMDLQEVGGGCGDWMELTQDRYRWRALVGTVRDFRVPLMR